MKVVLLSLIWLGFIIRFSRSMLSKQLRNAPSRRFILQLFLSCLALSLWGKEGEGVLDRYFNQLPVGVYVKYFALLWIGGLFYEGIRENLKQPVRWLRAIPFFGSLIGGMSFVYYILYRPFDTELLRYLVIGARDGLLFPLVLWGILPAMLKLWQTEEIPAMKLRLISAQVFSYAYLITAICSVIAAFFAPISYEYAANAAQAAQPFVWFECLLFIPILMPQSFLQKLCCLRKLYDLQRLEALKKRVAPHLKREKLLQLGNEVAMDLAIYRNVIAILDYYPLLKDEQEDLRQAIYSATNQHQEFKHLVKAMVSL